MTSISPDAVRAEISENSIVAGNPVKASTKEKGTASSLLYSNSSSQLAQSNALTASTPIYSNSSSVPTSGSFPFAIPVSGLTATTTTFLDLTGYSSLSGTADMTLQLVPATTGATTFTAAGYIKVTVTDSGGNLTNGDYYIQVGTLG